MLSTQILLFLVYILKISKIPFCPKFAIQTKLSFSYKYCWKNFQDICLYFCIVFHIFLSPSSLNWVNGISHIVWAPYLGSSSGCSVCTTVPRRQKLSYDWRTIFFTVGNRSKFTTSRPMPGMFPLEWFSAPRCSATGSIWTLCQRFVQLPHNLPPCRPGRLSNPAHTALLDP